MKPSETMNARLRRNRDKILRAAEKVFLNYGFRGSNLDEVAEVAGVSKQTVYAHFKSKRELFIAVISAMTGEAADEHRSRIESPTEHGPVDSYLTKYASELLSVVLTPRLLRLRRLVIGEAERFPGLGEALYRNGPASSIARLTKYFEERAARGELMIHDPQAAATYFNWIVMGAPTNQAMMLGDKSVPKPKELQKHVVESVRIFLAAYGPNIPKLR